MLLEGLYIPLTTPFHPDGRLNPAKLAANVARYSKTPAAGLIVLGPQGEATLLSDEETREALRTAVEAAAAEKVVIAGVSRDSVLATLALAEFAAEQQFDAVLVGLPSIFVADREQPTPRLREMLTYFRTVADRSPLPIVLGSMGARRISVDACVELAAHSNVLGLLDATADLAWIEAILQGTAAVQRNVTVTATFTAVTARMTAAASAATFMPATFISADTLAESLSGVLAAVDGGISSMLLAEPPDLAPVSAAKPLRTRTKSVGFQLLTGAAGGMLDALRAGASAVAPGFAACTPQACYEVVAAWKDGDQPLAEEKQARLNAAARVTEDGGGAGPGMLKFGCDFNGYFGGLPRLPHLPPTGSQRAELERLMEGMRN